MSDSLVMGDDLFPKPTFSRLQRDKLRGDIQKALEKIETDGSPTRWQDVYLSPSHFQALDPRRMVVEGMRGAGKSFWTGVLTDPEFRQQLAAQQTHNDLKEGLSQITQSYRIALDQHTTQATAFPNASELLHLLALPGVQPETIWMVAILRLFDLDPDLGMPQSHDPYDPWTAPIAWAGLNVPRVLRGLQLLDQRLATAKQTSLVVIDAIDRVSYDLSQVSKMGAGLLRVLLEMRFAQGLRLKAFFREDVLFRAGPSVVDGSKLLNNKVVLEWSENELYGLAFSRIAQHSLTFRNHFQQITRSSWRQDGAQRYVCHNVNNTKDQTGVWRALVGDYMGKTANQGHSYPYTFKHLSDGLERVAPRTFLVALKTALTETVEKYASQAHVIHHEAIKEGVREASQKRVEELRDDYAWIDPALRCISKAKKTVPIDWITLREVWLDQDAAVLNEIEAMREESLIPWSQGVSIESKMKELRATLEQIGIIKIRKIKGQDERIEIPDIYRLAYKIGRNGGIATRRRT